jgi:RNA polymerase sigma-70 factor (ECF subfamily)
MRMNGTDAAAVEELAARAAGGDAGALDDLLRRIEPDVLRRCRRFLPHLQDAEEACQDVLLQVARHIGGFEGRARFGTWLHVIIANCARQTYRGLKRRSLEQAAAEPPRDRFDPRTTSVIAGSRIDLLDALEALERRRAELVAPLVLRDLCQLPYADIAAHLALPVGTVKSRVHDARKHVQEALAERYA